MPNNKLIEIANQQSNSPYVFYGLMSDDVVYQKFSSVANVIWINPLQVTVENVIAQYNGTVNVEIFFGEQSSIDCPSDLRGSNVEEQRTRAYEYITRLRNDSSQDQIKIANFSINDEFLKVNNLHLSGVLLNLTFTYYPNIDYCYVNS